MEPINHSDYKNTPLCTVRNHPPAGRSCPAGPSGCAERPDCDQLILSRSRPMPEEDFLQAVSRELSQHIRRAVSSPSPPGRLESLRREIQNKAYSPDPQIIAQRLLESYALAAGEDGFNFCERSCTDK